MFKEKPSYSETEVRTVAAKPDPKPCTGVKTACHTQVTTRVRLSLCSPASSYVADWTVSQSAKHRCLDEACQRGPLSFNHAFASESSELSTTTRLLRLACPVAAAWALATGGCCTAALPPPEPATALAGEETGVALADVTGVALAIW